MAAVGRHTRDDAPVTAPIRAAAGRARSLLLSPRRAHADAYADADPGAQMFARIRRRLTTWYSLVLLGALLLCGVVFYLLISQVIFDPINRTLSNAAGAFGALWQGDSNRQCPLLAPTDAEARFFSPYYRRYRGLLYFACFDDGGALLRDSANSPALPRSIALPHSVARLVAQKAIHSSPEIATVDVGSDIGPVQIYARTILHPVTGRTIGVVAVAYPVDAQVAVLRRVLLLILTVGAVALLAAALGGLFLSRRALEPARLAFARQQSFIADASHELRTPLTLLRADAEVLLRGGDRMTPDDRALVEDIVAETVHMTALAGAMLALARLDAGRLHLERDVVDLSAIAARVGRRAAALAGERDVTVTVEDTGPLLVIGDHLLLEQTALILVDNAIKYNRAGGQVVLRVSRRAGGAGGAGGEAILEVCDTGIGVTRERLPHLGERFYRVDKARTREAGGAGLGLSIAHGIARAHGGALTLSSAPGAGTVARLSMPAAGDGR